MQQGAQKPGEHLRDSGVLHQPSRPRPQAQAPRHGQGKLYPGLGAADRRRRQRAAVAQNQRTENAYQNDARPYPAHDHAHSSFKAWYADKKWKRMEMFRQKFQFVVKSI